MLLLDDQQSSLSKKLYNYKETPPDKKLEKIEEELNNVSKEKTIVRPFFGKLNYKLFNCCSSYYCCFDHCFFNC
jgi:hypothetical protein